MSGRRVLIIDDDQDIIDVLTGRLESLGYEIEGFTDPVAGRRAAMSRPPNMIVLDIRMPTLDGMSLAESLKSLPAFENVPIVFYTSIFDESVQSRSRALGIDAFFTKGVDDRSLIQKIKEMLSWECS